MWWKIRRNKSRKRNREFLLTVLLVKVTNRWRQRAVAWRCEFAKIESARFVLTAFPPTSLRIEKLRIDTSASPRIASDTVICPLAWCVTPGDPETPVGAPCRPWEVAVGVVWQSVLAAVLVVVGPHGCWAEARVAEGFVWLDL